MSRSGSHYKIRLAPACPQVGISSALSLRTPALGQHAPASLLRIRQGLGVNVNFSTLRLRTLLSGLTVCNSLAMQAAAQHLS